MDLPARAREPVVPQHERHFVTRSETLHLVLAFLRQEGFRRSYAALRDEAADLTSEPSSKSLKNLMYILSDYLRLKHDEERRAVIAASFPSHPVASDLIRNVHELLELAVASTKPVVPVASARSAKSKKATPGNAASSVRPPFADLRSVGRPNRHAFPTPLTQATDSGGEMHGASLDERGPLTPGAAHVSEWHGESGHGGSASTGDGWAAEQTAFAGRLDFSDAVDSAATAGANDRNAASQTAANASGRRSRKRKSSHPGHPRVMAAAAFDAESLALTGDDPMTPARATGPETVFASPSALLAPLLSFAVLQQPDASQRLAEAINRHVLNIGQGESAGQGATDAGAEGAGQPPTDAGAHELSEYGHVDRISTERLSTVLDDILPTFLPSLLSSMQGQPNFVSPGRLGRSTPRVPQTAFTESEQQDGPSLPRRGLDSQLLSAAKASGTGDAAGANGVHEGESDGDDVIEDSAPPAKRHRPEGERGEASLAAPKESRVEGQSAVNANGEPDEEEMEDFLSFVHSQT